MTNLFLGTYFTGVLNTSTELNTNSAPTWKQSARIKTFTKIRDQTPRRTSSAICKYDIYQGPAATHAHVGKDLRRKDVDQPQARSFTLFCSCLKVEDCWTSVLKRMFTSLETYQLLMHGSKAAALPSLITRSLTLMKRKQDPPPTQVLPLGTSVDPFDKALESVLMEKQIQLGVLRLLRTTITGNLFTLYALTVHLYSYWSIIYLLLFWFGCASLICR